MNIEYFLCFFIKFHISMIKIIRTQKNRQIIFLYNI